MNSSNDRVTENGDRTPLWALIGAPLVLFLASTGAFWGAYVWMSVTHPLPTNGPAAVALAKAPSPTPVRPAVSERAPSTSHQADSRMRPQETARKTKTVAPPVAPVPKYGALTVPGPQRTETAPQRPIQAPCPIQVTESRLAQGKSVMPPAGRRVAIVLHRSGSSAEGNHEAELQVIAVVNNLSPADSFTVVATAGQGTVFAPKTVTPQPESVEALRTWMKALPGGTTSTLETGVSTALAMPAINKVVVVADVTPEQEAETWRRLSDVVRTGNRFGAAVSAVTVTPRCTPAIAPAKGQRSGSEEPPSVAREMIVTPGY